MKHNNSQRTAQATRFIIERMEIYKAEPPIFRQLQESLKLAGVEVGNHSLKAILQGLGVAWRGTKYRLGVGSPPAPEGYEFPKSKMAAVRAQRGKYIRRLNHIEDQLSKITNGKYERFVDTVAEVESLFSETA